MPELIQQDFKAIATNGWGDAYNAYCHSMVWFQDRLYAASFRANLCLIRSRNPPPKWPFYPVKCPKDPFSLDLRAQIWRFDPRASSWEHVYRSPLVIGRDGKEIPRDIGYRGMVVFQGLSDSAPVLYVSAFSPTRAPGPVILRSEDGMTFTPTSEPGCGYDQVSAFRSLIPFKGRLYTSPIGSKGNRPNFSRYPLVLESEDPAQGRWEPVSLPGFGNPNNGSVFEMAEFNGFLYAGTFNCVTGFELWKTDGEGRKPYRWTQVMRLGAYRGNVNEGAMSLCVFNNALYVGTGIVDGGYDRANRVGPAAGELIRVYPDDSWDLVMGNSRLTPNGLKVSMSSLGPGFGNFFSGYIWRICAHEDWLYVGTFDWSVFLPYAPLDQWPTPIRALIEGLGIDDTVRREGGFDLWKSQDGNHWVPITRTGFDNQYNYGVRTLVSTPYGLAVGTTNPFGPEVAKRRGSRWEYVVNPRGGLEVWLGKAQSPPPARPIEPAIVTVSPIKDRKRPERRGPRIDPTPYELSHDQLCELENRIDVRSVLPETLAFTRIFHKFSAEGTEHLPSDGPVIIASNHTGTPMFTGLTFITEDCLLTLDFLQSHLVHPARLLVDLNYYHRPEAVRLSQRDIEKLGYVPATLGNGIRLLEMGKPVLIYPEGRYSKPAYQLRPFFFGMTKMALMTGAPIIPTTFIGPHESRLRIERQGIPVILNMHRPYPVEYKMTFLSPIHVRDYVQSIDDHQGLEDFSEMVRGRIQAELDRQSSTRPLVKVAKRLQEKYGEP